MAIEQMPEQDDRDRSLAEVDDLLARGWNLPAWLYTDADLLELEVREVFRRSWQIVCIERDLKVPGDFMTATIAGVPVIVTRTKAGELAASVNVCRHRGKVVCDEVRGNKPTLICQYHAWSYELDGSFRAAPSLKAIQEVARTDELGLPRLAVDTWRGLVFVSLEPQEPLLDFLGELPAVLESNGSPFDFGMDSDLEFAGDVSVDIECNWKEWVENNHECYHCASVHPSTLGAVFDLGLKQFRTQTYDTGMYLSAPFSRGFAAEFGAPEPDPAKPDLEQYFIWPNTFFSTTAGHSEAFFRIEPLGPDKCRVVTLTYSHGDAESVPEETRRLMDVAFDDTVQEDIVMSEQAHVGLRSGTYRSGPLVPGREHLIAWFQQMYWRHLRPLVERAG